MTRIRILLFWMTVILVGAGAFGGNRPTGYDLSRPDTVLVLPEILHEISGLTMTGPDRCACVQDENGIVFIYDLRTNAIVRRVPFGPDGDYEGITRTGTTLYVLRSDGMIYEIDGYESAGTKVRSYDTGIPASDNEGLCYDRDNNRLLIACKSKIGKTRELKDKRAIYGFDLRTKTLSPEPVYLFDLGRIKAFAAEREIGIPLTITKKKHRVEPDIKFKPSAVAIQPLSGELYLLSSVDHLLFIFSRDGSIRDIARLDPALFNKPEGITFDTLGTMFISNEGGGGKPTILRFRHRGK